MVSLNNGRTFMVQKVLDCTKLMRREKQVSATH